MNANFRSFWRFKHGWWRLVFSILVVVLTAPLVALFCIYWFNPSRGVMITLILLASAPGAPLSPIKVFKAGGIYLYAVMLQVAVVIISVVTLPALLYFFHQWYDFEVDIHWLNLGKQLFKIVLLPLLLGMFVRWRFPKTAKKYGKKLIRLANLLLLATIIALLVIFRHYIFEAPARSIPQFIFFVTALLLLGHCLGGKTEGEKTTVSLLNASRHLGIAIYIGLGYYSLDKIMAFIVPYGLASFLVETTYVQVRRLVK